MTAQLTALQVADRIVRWAQSDGTQITPLQVQKLTYLCQGWALGLDHGPLFTDDVEAWRYGPVVSSVYHALKQYGGQPVQRPISEVAFPMSDDDERVIRIVWKAFGQFDGMQLSRMTHGLGGPWEQVCQGNPRSQTIPVPIIHSYFEGLVAASRAENNPEA